ncbi:hypothetical protein OOK58_44795 [Streptomyces sp. NBC_01728]|uniref:hypothetical protein n=1 Tax=unclassified Streptomyces TaxID=2593676 RepID=UPI00225BCB49|nr:MULTISPECIES: hypothetical protein [unclassified Streptomyces]MCX4459009.1 hypothetical protein [Streptomyces sp. NBC_01719]MCX4498366.1 hypothetical protein [Streptomyces sp. NBC_01728]
MKERDDGPAAPRDGVFERILDRALDSPEIMAAMEHVGVADTRERLRAEALQARPALSRAAAVEYDQYLRLRTSGRDDGPSKDAADTEDGSVSVSALLAPSLGVVAAGVYVLSGFDLHALDVRPHLNDGLIMVVVILAAVTAGAALGDLLWSLATRGRPTPEDRDPELRHAHEEWQLTLLEREVMPFLLGRLDGTVSVQPPLQSPLQPALQPSLQPSTRERPSQSDLSFAPGSAKK